MVSGIYTDFDIIIRDYVMIFRQVSSTVVCISKDFWIKFFYFQEAWINAINASVLCSENEKNPGIQRTAALIEMLKILPPFPIRELQVGYF